MFYIGEVNPPCGDPLLALALLIFHPMILRFHLFLGTILDGETHLMGFSVTNAFNVGIWMQIYIFGRIEEAVEQRGELLNFTDKPLVEL